MAIANYDRSFMEKLIDLLSVIIDNKNGWRSLLTINRLDCTCECVGGAAVECDERPHATCS